MRKDTRHQLNRGLLALLLAWLAALALMAALILILHFLFGGWR